MRPDRVWVADITYVRLRRDLVYLAVIMDVFTRLIRGSHLGRDLAGTLTRTALDRAFQRHRPETYHSDQGVQYAATDYVARLREVGAAVRMAAVGKPEANGFAERLMRTIQEEEVDLSDYEDYADARRQPGGFVDAVFNVKRIHSTLGYRERPARQNMGRSAPISGVSFRRHCLLPHLTDPSVPLVDRHGNVGLEGAPRISLVKSGSPPALAPPGGLC